MADEKQLDLDNPAVAEEFFRRIIHTAAVALVATDAQFRIVTWNAAAAELLGLHAEQMLGKHLEEAVPPERRKLLHRLLDCAARGETTQFNIRLPGDPGKQREVLVILSPILNRDGGADGIAAWLIDETKSKRLTERLAQAEKMASLGTLAGGVAHHFNNILGGVATFVDFALTSGDPSAMKRALQMTAEAAGRASQITQSLLSFAKADVHRADLADLTEVVLTFVHLVERPLAERKIELKLDLKPVPVVAIEANRMHQVMGNLLTNAEEAMPDGGTIFITVHRVGQFVELTFTDTGCGISAEHLPLVFEPFFTTKGLLSGGDKINPGLGLSVVHGIVLEMGGKIDVKSKSGEGTTFTITFPVQTT